MKSFQEFVIMKNIHTLYTLFINMINNCICGMHLSDRCDTSFCHWLTEFAIHSGSCWQIAERLTTRVCNRGLNVLFGTAGTVY